MERLFLTILVMINWGCSPQKSADNIQLSNLISRECNPTIDSMFNNKDVGEKYLLKLFDEYNKNDIIKNNIYIVRMLRFKLKDSCFFWTLKYQEGCISLDKKNAKDKFFSVVDNEKQSQIMARKDISINLDRRLLNYVDIKPLNQRLKSFKIGQDEINYDDFIRIEENIDGYYQTFYLSVNSFQQVKEIFNSL